MPSPGQKLQHWPKNPNFCCRNATHGQCSAPTAALVDSQRLQAFRCVLPNTHDAPYPSEPLQHRGDAEIADSRPRIRLPALTWLLPTLLKKSPAIPPSYTHVVEQKVASSHYMGELPSLHLLCKPWVLPHKLPGPTTLICIGFF